jgi:hypothetical protein
MKLFDGSSLTKYLCSYMLLIVCDQKFWITIIACFKGAKS